jgi:threonine aldolase
MKFHLDGARIFNAAVALGVPVSEIAEPFDSVNSTPLWFFKRIEK